jgi:hypothetical protein
MGRPNLTGVKRGIMQRKLIFIGVYLGGVMIFIANLSGCNSAPLPLPMHVNPTEATVAATLTPVETAMPAITKLAISPSPTILPSQTPTSTHAPTSTPAAKETQLPTMTVTPALSPTFAFPRAVIQMQANCRYGPGTAYLYSHGLYSSDTGEIHGRTPSGAWLWIKPENLERHCWAAASVMEVVGDIFTVKVQEPVLPRTTFAGPPENVSAQRVGEMVTVSWSPVDLTVDKARGYLIEAQVCQNGQYISLAVQTDNPFYEFTDEENCAISSSGRLYTAEKHGYSDPVAIPWP